MSVIIDGTNGVTSDASFYGKTPFTGTYTDGIVVDYTTGTGRITVGAADGLKIRNNGTSSPVDLVTVDSSGNLSVGYRAVVGQAAAGDSVFQVYSASYGGMRIGYNSTAVNYIDSGTLNFRNAAGSVTNAVIDSSGNLLVGYTSGGSSGYTGIVKAAGYNTKAGVGGSLNTNTFNINFGTGAQLWIDTTNLGTFSLTSDYRIKKDIQTQTLSALDRVAQLRPVTYEFGDYKDLF